MEETFLIDYSTVIFNTKYTFRVSWRPFIRFFGTHNYEFNNSYDSDLKKITRFVARQCNIGNLGLHFFKVG
jgi:hypothetical protein